jgi:hypothetical protein
MNATPPLVLATLIFNTLLSRCGELLVTSKCIIFPALSTPSIKGLSRLDGLFIPDMHATTWDTIALSNSSSVCFVFNRLLESTGASSEKMK